MEDFLRRLEPVDQFFGIVIPPDDVDFSRLPQLFAFKVLSRPPYGERPTVDHIHVNDIILVHNFYTVFTAEQMQGNVGAARWNETINRELVETARHLSENSNYHGGDTVAEPRSIPAELNNMIVNVINNNQVLYGAVHIGAIVAKVLPQV